MKKTLRTIDTVGRIGGEEFAILLPDTNIDGVETIAQRLVMAFNSECLYDGNLNVAVTMSIGVATYPQDGVTIKDILKHADDAMYIAKNNGKNQYRIKTI